MSIVKLKDKKSGVTYVYESESYWDKEKKQPRNKRTLIGKLDGETGEIIPTRRQNRKKDAGNSIPNAAESDEKYEKLLSIIKDKDSLIAELKSEISELKKERAEFSAQVTDLYKKWS